MVVSRLHKASSVAACVLAADLCAVTASTAPLITTVWPMPQSLSMGSTVVGLGPNFTIQCATAVCPDPISAAIARYSRIIFFAGPGATSALVNITGLDLFIQQDAALGLGVSENYTLVVPSTSSKAIVTADTQWGALRALESFSQLVSWASFNDTNYYSVPVAPVVIEDFPRFPWRGILIDTARNFLPVSAIKATLDAMSYNKMNRLHWHFVDDDSWALVSSKYPNFVRAAFAPTAVYTHADVKGLVQYALERGITIVPEFDVPAHAFSWGVGYPDLVISCETGVKLVDPTDTGHFYSTMDGLLEEFVPLFNTDVVHFGGDEVENYTCWQESAEVLAFAQRQGYSNMSQVRRYLEIRLQELAAKHGINSMWWEEVWDQGDVVNASAIINVWLSDDELVNMIKAGNRVVESYGLYLDQQLPPGDAHYFWMDTFLNFYLHDPLINRTDVTPSEAARVLGLSASQWGDQVDATNIQSRMWPRACAAAERMWSDQSVRDTTAVWPRIQAQRCHMAQRGIGAGPVRAADWYGYCALPPSSRFNQPHNDWSF